MDTPLSIPSRHNSQEDVLDVFRRETKELTYDQKEQVERIKNAADHLMEVILEQGANRELALAKTKLEEAVMWATKGITA